MKTRLEPRVEQGESIRFESGLSRLGFILRLVCVLFLALGAVTFAGEPVLFSWYSPPTVKGMIFGALFLIIIGWMLARERASDLILTNRRLLYKGEDRSSDIIEMDLSNIERMERLGEPEKSKFRVFLRDAPPIDLDLHNFRDADKFWSKISGVHKVGPSNKHSKNYNLYLTVSLPIFTLFAFTGVGLAFLIGDLVVLLPITDQTMSNIAILLALFTPILTSMFVGAFLTPIVAVWLLKSKISLEEAKHFMTWYVDFSSDSLKNRIGRWPIPLYENYLSRFYGETVVLHPRHGDHDS